MILTALFVYGAIQGAWSLGSLWIIFLMFFDLVMAAMLSPSVET